MIFIKRIIDLNKNKNKIIFNNDGKTNILSKNIFPIINSNCNYNENYDEFQITNPIQNISKYINNNYIDNKIISIKSQTSPNLDIFKSITKKHIKSPIIEFDMTKSIICSNDNNESLLTPKYYNYDLLKLHLEHFDYYCKFVRYGIKLNINPSILDFDKFSKIINNSNIEFITCSHCLTILSNSNINEFYNNLGLYNIHNLAKRTDKILIANDNIKNVENVIQYLQIGADLIQCKNPDLNLKKLHKDFQQFIQKNF